MQEIATGVYVGNFNVKVREKLWERVIENVSNGEATLAYASRNEIGYQFDTVNSARRVIDYEGIPLILLESEYPKDEVKLGFSKASSFRKSKKVVKGKKKHSYIVLDIETDGLDEENDQIIEIGALKVSGTDVEEFHKLICHKGKLSKEIVDLTGITDEILNEQGIDIGQACEELRQFIGDLPLVGYNIGFDIAFLNIKYEKMGKNLIKNQIYDLLQDVKRERLLQSNYKLETSLRGYGIEKQVPHRALEDARLIYQLSMKVNKFLERLE